MQSDVAEPATIVAFLRVWALTKDGADDAVEALDRGSDGDRGGLRVGAGGGGGRLARGGAPRVLLAPPGRVRLRGREGEVL
jgi:hypothetical protein